MSDLRKGEMLARFRADPAKVRVAIVREGGGWRAAVSSRVCGTRADAWRAWAHEADRAIDVALHHAAEAQLDGVDLGMAWAFEHPWGAAGVLARESLETP